MDTWNCGRGRLLVVEANDTSRGWDATWLDDAGFDVMTCPGPSAPDYSCIGSRTGTCPLASSADAVVLDMRLAGDVAGIGTRGWELLLLYRQLGLPVIVLRGDDDPFVPLPEEGVAVVQRPAQRESLLSAMQAILTP